jgi:hypothetical protein
MLQKFLELLKPSNLRFLVLALSAYYLSFDAYSMHYLTIYCILRLFSLISALALCFSKTNQRWIFPNLNFYSPITYTNQVQELSHLTELSADFTNLIFFVHALGF